MEKFEGGNSRPSWLKNAARAAALAGMAAFTPTSEIAAPASTPEIESAADTGARAEQLSEAKDQFLDTLNTVLRDAGEAEKLSLGDKESAQRIDILLNRIYRSIQVDMTTLEGNAPADAVLARANRNMQALLERLDIAINAVQDYRNDMTLENPHSVLRVVGKILQEINRAVPSARITLAGTLHIAKKSAQR